MGSDLNPIKSPRKATRFNTRSPCGERPSFAASDLPVQLSFNTRSPCGERPTNQSNQTTLWQFQHTLPERGATDYVRSAYFPEQVSTHAPRAGSDSRMPYVQEPHGWFQLTLPERGATYFAKVPLFINTSKGISRTVIRESFLHR